MPVGQGSSNDTADRLSTLQAAMMCQQSVFAEHKIASGLIHSFSESSDTRSCDELDSALAELREIFDKYLELPSLLDKYVESMVNDLALGARSLMKDSSIVQDEKYWSSPLPRQLSALYALSKVRGRKRVQKFLPHRVEDVHAILSTLQGVDRLSRNADAAASGSKNTSQPQLWESLYVLWSWMGILSLVPFRSSVVIDVNRINELIELGKEYLTEAGPTRDMSSACLASWLSRPDLEQTHLESFQEWSTEVLQKYLENPARETMRAMGVLQTLVTILKVSTSDRQSILHFVAPLKSIIIRIAEIKPGNLLLRKYLVKWWTRTGTLYMPPRVASWRYQRGHRSLEENLLRSRTKASIAPLEEKKSDSVTPNEKSLAEYELFHVPDQVEDALGEVILGLTDASTIVRWSAAKGVGRVTERLPAICSDDVLDAILDIFRDREKDNDWHGACLAMAELARRGLLLPHRLHQVIPKIVEAIHYDVPRRQTSVGAHVRDAACYAYWAIARAYSPEALRPFASELSQSVVTAFLFDREVNCRRAAAAAFQEFVGRQGATNFRNGIAILTKADFFSLGNRADAYLSIAPEIAVYEEFKAVIIDHVYKVKLQHWDQNIRSLSAQCLGKLTTLDIAFVGGEVVQYLLQNSLDERNLQLRHGSVLGLAEVILAIGEMKASGRSIDGLLAAGTLLAIVELVPAIEKRRLYRGRGGEQMRAAICRLIECISIAELPLTVPQQVRLLDSIDACVPHPNEQIQDRATIALSQLMSVYFPVGPKGPSDRLQNRVVDKYVVQVKKSNNPAATRGFSMALGRLPAKILAPTSDVLDLCLDCLCRISRPDATVGNDKDVETRRNALVSIARICQTVGLRTADDQTPPVGLTMKQVSHVFTALFRGLEDYSMERRGDVGSMSRIAAMHGLVSLARTIYGKHSASSDLPEGQETITRIIAGLLKQLAEKLDAVRNEAGLCLVRVVTQKNPAIPFIEEKGRLCEYLRIQGSREGVNWADAATTFPRLIRVLDIDVYFDQVLAGLVVSVGCLTQSVAREASVALVRWVKSADDGSVNKLGNAMLDLFGKHKHDGRVILPLLKTISLLMNRLCIDRLVEDISFAEKLLGHLREEESSCEDVHRLAAIIDVALGLVGAKNDCQKELIGFLCKLLMHPFPRVRRITAENLYVKLVEKSYMDDDHPGLGLLLTRPWDGPASEEEIKNMAMEAISALNMKLIGMTET